MTKIELMIEAKGCHSRASIDFIEGDHFTIGPFPFNQSR